MIFARTACVAFVIFLLFGSSVVSQQSLTKQTERYSPDGSEFTMEVPGRPSSSQNRVFDPNADGFVYRLIEPGKPRIYNFEIKQESRPLFLVSILQISFVERKSPRYLTQKQIDTINTLIHDDIIISEPLGTLQGRTKTTRWSYRDELTGDPETRGLIVAKFTPRNLFVIVVIANYGDIGAPEVNRMLTSFSEKD